MTDTTARPLTALDHVEKIAQHYDSDIEGCDPECAATLRALAARVAELEAERDAARAEVARLRDALRPFATSWSVALASGLTSMANLGAIARVETPGVHFKNARAAMQEGDT